MPRISQKGPLAPGAVDGGPAGAGERDPLVVVTHRRVFNCFLVIEDDGLTLVDTGPAGAAGAIIQQTQTLGLPIRRIVITHGHHDHLGGLDLLVRELASTRPEVFVGEREAPLIRGDFARAPGEPDLPAKARSYRIPQTSPTHTVRAGQMIGSLKVLETPGHTPGHISLLDTRERTLIAGDAIGTIGRTSVSGDLVWRWPFPAFTTWSREIALGSARMLLEERPTRLACGHGPLLTDASERLTAAIAHAERGLS